jgi:TP901 family phage tail tape measure protein
VQAGTSHTIGVLVQGHNALSGALVKAESSLAAFRKTAEATALSINNKLSPADINTGAIDKASNKLSGMGTSAMIAGGVIAAGLGVGVAAATKFNTAMAEVSTLVDTSTVDMNAMSSQVQSLSKEFGVMPVDTAKAMYTTLSAGFTDAKDAAVLLEGAMKLSRGGLAELGGSIDGLTSIMNSYGIKAQGVGQVSDYMFVAMKQGKTTIGELSANLGKVTPLAASAGVGLDELLAATSALTLGGLNTAEAVTSLRGTLNAVIKPSSEALKVAKDLGIQFDTAAIQSMGLANWLTSVKEKTGGDQAVMAKLFGSVEALSGVLALTGNQAGSFNAILAQMGTSAGATDEAFQKVNSSASAAFDRAKANATVLLETMGNALLPIITGLADSFTWLADRISAFAEAHPFLSKLVVVLGAVSAAVAIIGGAALVMGGKVMAAMSMVNVSTGGVLLAVGALVTGITALVMYFSSGSEDMADSTGILATAWEYLKVAWYAVATPIAYGVGYLVGMLTKAWRTIAAYTQEIWPLLKQVILGAWDGVMLVLGPGIAVFKAMFQTAWEAIKIVTFAVWDAIKLTVVTIWNGIYESILLVWNLISGLFKAALQALTGDWSGAWETIKSTFGAVWENLKNLFTGWMSWLTGLTDIFLDAGKALVNALWEGIKAAWGGLVSGVSDLLTGLRDLLPFSDAKAGPLSQLTASGSAFVTTFSEGITSAARVPIEALSGLLEGLRELLPFSDARKGPLSNLTASGAAVLPTFASGIERGAAAPARAVSDALAGVSLEAPRIPPLEVLHQGATSMSPPPRETVRSAGPSVVFQRGAFAITVNGASGLDDLETRLTDIFARAALRLGVSDA